MEDVGAKRLNEKRVLIVDDDPDVLAILKQAMQSEGALTQCCSDGNTAVHISESDPPDLVLLDMMLPKRSGFLVLEQVKRGAKPPAVIMITANEGSRHKAYAEMLGVDDYIRKPFAMDRLMDSVKRLLG